MVSQRSRERPMGNGTPASRPCLMGQRPHPMVPELPEDGQGWAVIDTSPTRAKGQPDLPSHRSGYRDERDGSLISDHLQAFAEYIMVNVGGPCGEGCRPPMKRMGVGGAIVLGGRESRPRGEGRQGIDALRGY
jgi:hypothetical protein